MLYLYSYINIQSQKLYQVYGSPIFERINVHIQRYLHEAFNEKIWIFSCWVQIVKQHDNGFLSQYITSIISVCFFLYAIKCMLIFGVKLPSKYLFNEIWVSLRFLSQYITSIIANFQHNKQLMTCIYASFVHLTSN